MSNYSPKWKSKYFLLTDTKENNEQRQKQRIEVKKGRIFPILADKHKKSFLYQAALSRVYAHSCVHERVYNYPVKWR